MCIESVDYYVLVNNESVGSVILLRGLCQGDYVSPHLFIICSEELSSLIRDVEDCDVINGTRVCKGAPQCLIFSLPMIASYSLKPRQTKLK